jgi:hypothetical protein
MPDDIFMVIRKFIVRPNLCETMPAPNRRVDISLKKMTAGLYTYALFINGERVDGKKMVKQ